MPLLANLQAGLSNTVPKESGLEPQVSCDLVYGGGEREGCGECRLELTGLAEAHRPLHSWGSCESWEKSQNQGGCRGDTCGAIFTVISVYTGHTPSPPKENSFINQDVLQLEIYQGYRKHCLEHGCGAQRRWGARGSWTRGGIFAANPSRRN